MMWVRDIHKDNLINIETGSIFSVKQVIDPAIIICREKGSAVGLFINDTMLDVFYNYEEAYERLDRIAENLHAVHIKKLYEKD